MKIISLILYSISMLLFLYSYNYGGIMDLISFGIISVLLLLFVLFTGND